MDQRADTGGREEEEEGDAIDEEGGHLMQTMSNENDAGGLMGSHGQEWAGISAVDACRMHSPLRRHTRELMLPHAGFVSADQIALLLFRLPQLRRFGRSDGA